jgi:hypothetical protein
MSDVALGVGVTAGVFFTLTGLSVLVYFWHQRRARQRQLAITTGTGPRAVAAEYPDLGANSKSKSNAMNDEAHFSARSERSNSNVSASARERAPTATQYAPINKRNSVPIAKQANLEVKHSAYSDVPRQSAVADDQYSALPGRSNIDGVNDPRYDPLPLGPPTDSAESIAVSKSYGYSSAASARAKAEEKDKADKAKSPPPNNPNLAVVVGVHSMAKPLVPSSPVAAVTSQRFIDDESIHSGAVASSSSPALYGDVPGTQVASLSPGEKLPPRRPTFL